jgi:hypothetical protein
LTEEQPAQSDDEMAVVVGWMHRDLGSAIDLHIQSAPSQQALDEKRIDNRHLLMTHNQALLLAKYLLDATGQTLPLKVKPSIWRKLFGARNK